MNTKEAAACIRTLSLGNLQEVLSAMRRPQTGRVASLRARVTRVLQNSATVDDCVRVINRIKNASERAGSLRPRSAAADTTSKITVPHCSDYDEDSSRSSAQSPEEIFSRLPIHPDVKFKSLPFYEELSELIKPTSLNTTDAMNCMRPLENYFKFHLTPTQAQLIKGGRNPPEYLFQVLIRIGLNETTSEQMDCFPPGMSVSVNGHSYPLPPLPNNAVNPEKMQPLAVTQFIRLDPIFPNQVQISARPHFQRFVFAVYLVKKLTSQNLLSSLRNKGVKVACYTKAMIIQKLKSDENEIALTYLLVKLTCPLSKKRIQVPCRATTCEHVQCFDCATYLQLNERKPTWLCPVCNKIAHFENLSIDEYFQEILASNLADGSNEVQLMKDGNWCPVGGQKEQDASAKSAIKREKEGSEVELLTLSDSEDECAVVSNWTKSQKPVSKEVEVFDLSDDDSPPQVFLPPKKLIPERSIAAASQSKKVTSSEHIIYITSDSDQESDAASEKGSSRSSSYESDSGDQLPLLNPAAVQARLSASKPQPSKSDPSVPSDSPVEYAINQAKSSSTTLVISKKMLADNTVKLPSSSAKTTKDRLAARDSMEKCLIINPIVDELVNSVFEGRGELSDDEDNSCSSEASESQACHALLGLASWATTLKKPYNVKLPSTSTTATPDNSLMSAEHEYCLPDGSIQETEQSRAVQRRTEGSFRPSILRRSVRTTKGPSSTSPPLMNCRSRAFSSESDSGDEGASSSVGKSGRTPRVIDMSRLSDIFASLDSESSEEYWDNMAPFNLHSTRKILSDSDGNSEKGTSIEAVKELNSHFKRVEADHSGKLERDRAPRTEPLPRQANAARKLNSDGHSSTPPVPKKCTKVQGTLPTLSEADSSRSANLTIEQSLEAKSGSAKKKRPCDDVSSSFVPAILKRTQKKCLKRSALPETADSNTFKHCRKDLLTPVAELPQMADISEKKKRKNVPGRGRGRPFKQQLTDDDVEDEDGEVRDEGMDEVEIPEAGCSQSVGRRQLRPRAPHSYHERSPSPFPDDEQSVEPTSAEDDEVSSGSDKTSQPSTSKPNILRKTTTPRK